MIPSDGSIEPTKRSPRVVDVNASASDRRRLLTGRQTTSLGWLLSCTIQPDHAVEGLGRTFIIARISSAHTAGV